MDKIIKIIIILLMLISCSNRNEFNKDKHQINYVYEKFTTIHLTTGDLNINYLGLTYNSKVSLSDEENLKIRHSFNKYNMGKRMNEVWCMDENAFMPAFNDEIRIYHKNKLQSELNINFNYDLHTFQWHDQEYRIVSFRNEIKTILENNKDFKKALDTLDKFTKQKSGLFL